MIDTKTWGAFRQIDLSYVIVDGVQRVQRSEGFGELWQIDYSLENL
jgi:hypothetical protein